MKPLYKFLLLLSVITAAAIIPAWAVFEFTDIKQPPGFYFSYLFFFLITIIIYWLVIYSYKKYPSRLPAFFMGGTFLKLAASFAYMIIYALSFPEFVKTFLIGFFLIYFIYNFFEIFFLFKRLKGNIPPTE